jgi:hypothetical protein
MAPRKITIMENKGKVKGFLNVFSWPTGRDSLKTLKLQSEIS